MKYLGKHQEYLEVIDINTANCNLLKNSGKSELSLLWFTSDENKFTIDAERYTFNKNEIVSLTEFHKIEVDQVHSAKLLRWNRALYCIIDHDSEVSCKGVLYYGASNLPVVRPTEQDVKLLNTVWDMLLLEIESRDNLQLEMLQMMVKRVLILCTRIYKMQENYNSQSQSNVDIIREYNFLVEQHFREKHSVAEYAELLFKSPKTLSNVFKKLGTKTPLQFIQDRIMLESRRLLSYSDKHISEIGYDLGFSDIQVYSRFFKKQEGSSPSDFREKAI